MTGSASNTVSQCFQGSAVGMLCFAISFLLLGPLLHGSCGITAAHVLLLMYCCYCLSSGSPPSDGPARRLLVAQHRSSMAPTQILPRLATATSLTRLDLCVDQHWPSSVLAQIKDLARLPALTTFHLDCGRREGAEQFLTGKWCSTNSKQKTYVCCFL